MIDCVFCLLFFRLALILFQVDAHDFNGAYICLFSHECQSCSDRIFIGKHRTLLQEYNPHTMSEEEVKLLNVKHLQRNDTGAYLCRVLNEYGFADLIHHVIVLPGTDDVHSDELALDIDCSCFCSF